ncbi:protein of unknown function [Cupriavidus taiwanensis]|nr:protein of unknown function [Cupriavidus taiwanensis]
MPRAAEVRTILATDSHSMLSTERPLTQFRNTPRIPPRWQPTEVKQ